MAEDPNQWTPAKRQHMLALIRETVADADGDGLILTDEHQPDTLAEALMQLVETELLGIEQPNT